MNDCRERRKQRLFGSGKEDGGGLYPREKDESEETESFVFFPGFLDYSATCNTLSLSANEWLG